MDGLQVVMRGVMIGLFVAAPVGPNAVLCIRRTLSDGAAAGVRSGLGVASVHALYAGLAVGGAGGMSGWIASHRAAVRLVGGLLLVGLGVRLLRRRGETAAGGARHVSTILVGLTNPLTLVTFSAVAATGVTAGGTRLTVAGVFAGSALWWVVLASVVSTLGRRLSDNGMHRVNQASAATVGCFGLAAVASAI